MMLYRCYFRYEFMAGYFNFGCYDMNSLDASPIFFVSGSEWTELRTIPGLLPHEDLPAHPGVHPLSHHFHPNHVAQNEFQHPQPGEDCPHPVFHHLHHIRSNQGIR